MHPRARLSLYYPVAYLIGTGVALLAAPGLAMRLLFSTGDYGDVMPRMAGALCLALGLVVLQIVRLRIDSFYPTLIWVRVMLCAAWLWLFAISRDPFFLAVFGVVFAGLAWTSVGYWLDRRGKVGAS